HCSPQSFPPRRSSDLDQRDVMLFLLHGDRASRLFRERGIDTREILPLIFPEVQNLEAAIRLSCLLQSALHADHALAAGMDGKPRSEEHTSELQSGENL